MKKHILSGLLFAAILLSVASCGRGSKKKNAGDGSSSTRSHELVISLSDSLINHRKADTIDFGRVREGERVIREFKVKNAEDKALVITRLDLSCGCIEAEYPKQPIKPGEEGSMKLTLDTRNLGGWIFKSVIMQTSLSPKPYLIYVIAEIE